MTLRKIPSAPATAAPVLPNRILLKTVLQDTATSMYLERANKWTPQARNAFAFGDAAQAVEFCKARRWVGVRVLTKHPENEHLGQVLETL